MPTVKFSDSLKQEYKQLFNTCTIRPERMAVVDQTVAQLQANQMRYQAVADGLEIPWSFVAVIHNMEASLNFNRHLHNGDPLTARTRQVPQGRPKTGKPPFSWEESARDALRLKRLGPHTNWSLAGTLYQLERYNGWGYRLYHQHVLSPYLWGFSHHYNSGKYIADGTWSDTAVSRQCGAAVLLRRLAEIEQIEFTDQPAPQPDTKPLIVGYTMRTPKDPAIVAHGKNLQNWLNTYPGIFVKVDGAPGKRTSDAYKKVTGYFLPGDPRT